MLSPQTEHYLNKQMDELFNDSNQNRINMNKQYDRQDFCKVPPVVKPINSGIQLQSQKLVSIFLQLTDDVFSQLQELCELQQNQILVYQQSSLSLSNAQRQQLQTINQQQSNLVDKLESDIIKFDQFDRSVFNVPEYTVQDSQQSVSVAPQQVIQIERPQHTENKDKQELLAEVQRLRAQILQLSSMESNYTQEQYNTKLNQQSLQIELFSAQKQDLTEQLSKMSGYLLDREKQIKVLQTQLCEIREENQQLVNKCQAANQAQIKQEKISFVNKMPTQAQEQEVPVDPASGPAKTRDELDKIDVVPKNQQIDWEGSQRESVSSQLSQAHSSEFARLKRENEGLMDENVGLSLKLIEISNELTQFKKDIQSGRKQDFENSEQIEQGSQDFHETVQFIPNAVEKIEKVEIGGNE